MKHTGNLTTQTIKSDTEQKRILYVIDDINYSGGGHIATARQVAALSADGYSITIFSGTAPQANALNSFGKAKIIHPESNNLCNLFF